MSVIQVGLVDKTGKLDPALVESTAAALNIQVMRDLPQYWNVKATVRHLPNAEQDSRWRLAGVPGGEAAAGRGWGAPGQEEPALLAGHWYTRQRRLDHRRQPRDAGDAGRSVRQSAADLARDQDSRQGRRGHQRRARVPGRSLRSVRGQSVRVLDPRHRGVRLHHAALLRSGRDVGHALQLRRQPQEAAATAAGRLHLVRRSAEGRGRADPVAGRHARAPRSGLGQRARACASSSTARRARKCETAARPIRR